MRCDGWLWTPSVIGSLIPPALAGTSPAEIPDDGYDHPDYDPDDYADRSERARVRWTVDAPGAGGQASLVVRERPAGEPLTEDDVDSDAHLYDDGETSFVRRVPKEQRAVFGTWAYVIDRAAVVGRSWTLSGDRLHYLCRFPTGSESRHPVPVPQLFASAEKALALIENPPAVRVRPSVRVPAPSDYRWR